MGGRVMVAAGLDLAVGGVGGKGVVGKVEVVVYSCNLVAICTCNQDRHLCHHEMVDSRVDRARYCSQNTNFC